MLRTKRVRWYHQSWAVIGGLLVVGGFFVFSLQSTLFLALFELIVVGSGLWFFFGVTDRTLVRERPAILEMRDWLRGDDAPLLPVHDEPPPFFLLIRSRPHDIEVALARALQRWGQLYVPNEPDRVEVVRDLARRARLVFVVPNPNTRSRLAELLADEGLRSKTILLVPPTPEANRACDRPASHVLRSLGVDVALPADPAPGVLVAMRSDDLPPTVLPVGGDGDALRSSLVRARPDLVNEARVPEVDG